MWFIQYKVIEKSQYGIDESHEWDTTCLSLAEWMMKKEEEEKKRQQDEEKTGQYFASYVPSRTFVILFASKES